MSNKYYYFFVTQIPYVKQIYCTINISNIDCCMLLRSCRAACDRITKWDSNIYPLCVLCKGPWESREHLFFTCPYLAFMWEKLTKGMLTKKYTTNWVCITHLVQTKYMPDHALFMLRYVFETTIHVIWRGRNRRKHGEAESPPTLLIKNVDNMLRNRALSIHAAGDKNKYFFDTCYTATQQLLILFFFSFKIFVSFSLSIM